MRLRKQALVVVALSFLLLASCFRYETVWAGTELDDSGHILRLAASPGLCGCVTLGNSTKRPMHLHAKLDGVLVGQIVLAPAQRLSARFDWAGDTSEHAYVLEVFDADGKRLRLRDAVYLGEHSGWRNCANPGCEWGPLNMHVASTEQQR